MPISASQIVQVNPRLLKPGGIDLELNGLLLSPSDTIPAGLVLAFGEPDAVGSYFGLQSPEYAQAQVYFLGYNNSFLKPRALYITRRMASAAAPWLRGGKLATSVAQIKAVTDGTLTLTLGSHTATLTALSFAAITSFSDAALILQGAIRAETAGGEAWTDATVTYLSLFGAFVITGGETGAEQTVDYASGTVADLLLLTLAGGGVSSQGTAAQTPAETMQAVLEQTQNWATFATVATPSESEVLAFAMWANGNGVNYLYLYNDLDPNLLLPGNTATSAAALKIAELSAVAGIYGSPVYAAFLMGAIACIDWNRTAGTITTAFKSQDGLAPTVENSTDAQNLMDHGMNFYGNYATRNDQFVFLYPGSMFGRYLWVDPFVNAIWLNNALQVALMAGLSQSPRTPYTDAGYTLVRSWMQDPVNRALKNGVIEGGVVLSESQKAQINREAGLNIVPEVEQLGYYIQVVDAGPQVRTTRDSPTVNLWYTYGGSINRLVVASTALV